MIFTPSSATNCQTFSDPSPWSVTYLMDGPFVRWRNYKKLRFYHIHIKRYQGSNNNYCEKKN